jgi:nucleoid DNA-binding protein
MKRKLKPLSKRKPEETTTSTQMARAIMADTGFRESDIQIVLRSMTAYIKETMIEGKAVSVPKLGIFYPLLKPSRVVMSMNGGVGKPTKMTMKDRWQMKFRPSESVQGAMAEVEVTKEDIDNLYID